MKCQQFKEMIDSYISDELLVETNHACLNHLENCPACRKELSVRRNLHAQLRSAVRTSPEMIINPVFAARLERNLRETTLRPPWWQNLIGSGSFLNQRMFAAVATCLLVMVGMGGFWMKYHASLPDNNVVAEIPVDNTNTDLQASPSPLAQAVQIAWREITFFAIGDHLNCALDYKLKEDPISLEEASKKYGEYNKNLDRTIIESLREVFSDKASAKIKFLESHSCVFEGKRFAHIVLKYQNHIVSVLVTKAELPAEIGDAFSGEASNNLQVSQFTTKHHAVFVVSDLTSAENLSITQAIKPAVRQHMAKFDA